MKVESELYVEDGKNKFNTTVDDQYTFNHETISRVIGILTGHRYGGIKHINLKLEKQYVPSTLTKNEKKLINYLIKCNFIHLTYHGYYNATKKNFDRFGRFISIMAKERQRCRRNEKAMFRDSIIDHLIAGK